MCDDFIQAGFGLSLNTFFLLCPISIVALQTTIDDEKYPIPHSNPPSETPENNKPDEKSAETQAKPANNKTPDGKNVLAASDIKNKDGTYTQEDFNPSKIPYSQITLENAAEAFPFLGYTGQTPNYIEILPDDNASIIADKYDNLIGKDPKEWGTLAPYHTYKSKEEHDAAIAEEQCKIEEEQKRQQEGRADLEAGEHIGGNISEEEFESIWTFD